MSEGFLHKVYSVRDLDATKKLYDDWADSYEQEVTEYGYVTPQRCAEALRKFTTDVKFPILDFGCGTGMSGLALKLSGFSVIDGIDVSADMLSVAHRKNIYRKLLQIDANSSLPIDCGSYSAILAAGVLGAGAAPIAVLST